MSLPTPEAVALEHRGKACDGSAEGHKPETAWFVDCRGCLAAAIRADRLRVLDAVDAAVRGNQTTYARPIVEVLRDLRREIEES